MNSKVKSKEKKELYKLAYYDKLTGVYNKNRLDDLMEFWDEYIKDLEMRNFKSCYVSMVTVPDFKNINTQHGEEATDEILKICAKLIKGFAYNPIVFRIGDSEFLVLSEKEFNIPSSVFSMSSVYKGRDMSLEHAIKAVKSRLNSECPLYKKPEWSSDFMEFNKGEKK